MKLTIVNPYFCYCISFAVALASYGLGWSDLYPPLSGSLFVFVFATIAAHFWSARKFANLAKVDFTPIAPASYRTPLFVTLFIYLLWAVEFLYEGGVPLLKILLKKPYDYRLFGVPSLHVFVVTFSSFYTIYLFHLYLSSRKRDVLFLYLINLFAAILIYSRAMFFFNLSASFVLFLLSTRRFPRYLPYALPVVFLLLFYFFGVLGTLRVSREAGKAYDNTLFLKAGEASASFQQSPIPREYFWTYVYVSSPLANLQKNVNTFQVPPPGIGRLGEFVNNEILMDFISKRVNRLLHLEREKEYTIPGPFNVSTVYSRAFSYLGWTGMVLMATVVLLIPLAYMKLIPKTSPFFLTGFAILCTMFLFLAYDNTIRFTGLSFQLVYPIVFSSAMLRFPIVGKIFL